MRSSNEEPGGHPSSCEVTSATATAWKYNTCPVSDHFDVFKEDTLNWRFIRLSSLFLFVFSSAKALMGPRSFCARYLNLMHWGLESNTHILLQVNVHPNSHTKERENTDPFSDPPRPGDEQHLRLLRGTKQFLCWSERLWLQWNMHPKGDSWQFRTQGPLLWADKPHQNHFNDLEKQPWLKIKRQKSQE